MSSLRRASLFAALALIACVAIVWWWSPTTPEAAVERAESLLTRAQPLTLTEPVGLQIAPTPGDTWRQSIRMWGSATTRDFFNADQTVGIDFHLGSVSRAQAGTETGQIVVDHQVTQASIDSDLTAIHPRRHDNMRRGAREMEDALRSLSITETLDQEGRRLGATAEIDLDRPQHADVGRDELVHEPIMLSLVCLLTGAPAEPPAVGDSWSHEIPLISFERLSVPVTSTLDRIEVIDGERVAVITSNAGLHYDPMHHGRIVLARETRTLADPSGASRFETVEIVCRALDIVWSQEARHRLSDGLRLVATGRFTFHGEAGVDPRAALIDDSKRSALEMSLEYLLQAEPEG